MKQLQQEMVRLQLLQRRARGMAETRVGARDQLGERVVGEGLADEGPHDAEGDLLVRQPRQRRDVARAHARHLGRHVEPAVARKARQHRLFECQFGGLAPGGDVAHGASLDHGFRLIRHRRKSVIPIQSTASENHVTA